MRDENTPLLSSKVLRLAALGLLAFVGLSIVSGLVLTSRGKAEMTKSDAAFDSGDLRGSIAHAKQAALAFVPGASHVKAAYGRLDAIARGAEAQGDEGLATIAWDALRVVHEQTDYPGRPRSAALERAVENLKRLREARAHKVGQK